MDPKQKMFIYDKKEMVVLSLLGIFVALFAFTLGIHLGKKLVPPHQSAEHASPDVEAHEEAAPSRQEIAEQGKNIEQTVDETLDRSLHQEVVKTGIKLDKPKQIQLPKHAKSKTGGATTVKHQHAAEKSTDTESVINQDKFVIQVGSFPAIDEAREKIKWMESKGLRPILKIAEIKDKGVWYRVFVPGFSSKEEAEKAGKKYQSEKIIDSFIISRNTE